jgi:osmoprotectant transport system permease protein
VPDFDWGWIADHRSEIATQLWEHLELTVEAVGFGLAIAFPLAIYAYRHRWFYGPVTSVTGILYTIPSLALFAFLVPYTGLTRTTALIGLVSYTLLILIRNIVAGLEGVPTDAQEAARGMGYSDRQMLWRVELPLALPVIVAGVRLATVTVIGLVTVTALIGLGGLGDFILQGLRQQFPTASFLGAILSLALAVVADAAIVIIEGRITPWTRRSGVRAAG